MNKKLWTFNEIGTATSDCDANDYYYTWVELHAGNKSLEEIFDEFLGTSRGEIKIRVKARKGAIFIVVAGDKDDTASPTE